MERLVVSLLIPLLFFYVIKSQYSIIQSYHYEINKYFKYETTKKTILIIVNFILLMISFYLKNLMYNFICLISIIINVFFINKEKLKCTKRIKRFYLIYYLVTAITYTILPFNFLQSILILNNLIIFLLIVSHFISSLIEHIILNVYAIDAKKYIKDKKVIGITGSYGKTSCKNMIYDMLKNFSNVSKTPKSFNTKVGIIKSIRENINEFDDIFICEYGVDKKGGMDKLLKVVKPNISLITEIGPQHILTFKSIENIVNEKTKIAKCLKEDETVVINNDNKYLKNKKKDFKCKVISYGIKTDSDVMAKNISVSKYGSTFDLFIKQKFTKTITINILGEHNILNVLGSIGVLIAMNINIEKIDYLVGKIKPVEHRLELKKINGIKVIDDSFNSNELGFKNAVDTLCLMEGEKIVITPGVIEQGANSEKVNYELGKYMSDKVDIVVLEGENSAAIKKGLINGGFNKEKIFEKNNFFESWELIKKIQLEEKIILIENDLPSIYLK